jgi:hypothetical protein
MEEKASNLDEENKMLLQAVASIPTIKSPSNEYHELEVPNIQVPDISMAKPCMYEPTAANKSCAYL